MEKVWSLMTKILLALLLVSFWFLYDKHKQYEILLAERDALKEELVVANQSISQLTEQNEELEKKSVEGLLRETNKVVVSGWETLLNTVEEELNKAKEMIQQKQQLGNEVTEPDSELKADPKAESKDQASPEVSDEIIGERT